MRTSSITLEPLGQDGVSTKRRGRFETVLPAPRCDRTPSRRAALVPSQVDATGQVQRIVRVGRAETLPAASIARTESTGAVAQSVIPVNV